MWSGTGLIKLLLGPNPDGSILIRPRQLFK